MPLTYPCQSETEMKKAQSLAFRTIYKEQPCDCRQHDEDGRGDCFADAAVGVADDIFPAVFALQNEVKFALEYADAPDQMLSFLETALNRALEIVEEKKDALKKGGF